MAQQIYFGSNFRILGKLGEGSFAQVFKVKSLKTQQVCAIKRLKKRYRSREEAMNLPEIVCLKQLQGHPNILKLLEVMYDSNNGFVAIATELLDKNLYELIRDHRRAYSERVSLFLIYQLLKGLAYMHEHHLFHRDVKPENCLVNEKNFELKLIDFGCTRPAAARGPFTEYVSTRWYRAPECILTSGSYGPEVDVWAAGCVLYELLTTKPLFPGKHELDQISKIHFLLGTPARDLLAQFRENPNRQISFSFPQRRAQDLRLLLPNTNADIVNLLKSLLEYDPHRRATAQEALDHPAFQFFREQEELWAKSGTSATFAEFVSKQLNGPPKYSMPSPAHIAPTANPVAHLSHVHEAPKNAGHSNMQGVGLVSNKININPQPKPFQVQHKPAAYKQPSYQFKGGLDLAESRRVAAERIKQYNKKNPNHNPPPKAKLPPLHAAMPTVVLQKSSNNPGLHPIYQKPHPDLIQPSFKNVKFYS